MTTTLARQPVDASPTLHYYLVHDRIGEPDSLLVEELLPAPDHSSAGLVSGVRSRRESSWRDGADTSRRLRLDAALRLQVVAVGRAAAAEFYRSVCGVGLPDEAALRAQFGELPAQPPRPLRLSGPEAAPGFRETRVYRILFVNELTQDGLDALSSGWQMPVVGDLVDPEVRILGAVHRQVSGDCFRWDLRRVAAGAAWGLDVTCDLAGERDEAVGVLLRGLTAQMRQQGLIPVTVDRFR
ncbi:hypothetical protein [Paractinoplanes abujensis]|uniref:Uncharacterized protein n=1 Tax=Paractinoplanes abujensis TaxID=882441 RepID=A0A7W7CLD0_9ACTN|nr:hypothetical protein [Actinoplanes abujensis]MBB4690687.1 hypothetical protein [Actinoplanes abujensis]